MARDRVKEVAWFNIASRVIMVLVVAGASFYWRSPVAAVWGLVISAGLVFLPSLRLMLNATRESLGRYRLASAKSQVVYSIPLGLGGIVGRVAYGLDKIIVASMCSPETFAIYANGAMEIPLVRILTGSMTSVLVPEMSSLCQKGNRQAALDLVTRGACKCALILYPMLFVLFFMAPEIMVVLFTKTYIESALPFRVYLFFLPLRVINYGSLFMATGQSHLIMIRAIGDLVVNFILTVALIKIWGYIGAAIATLMTIYFWQMPFNTYFIRREYNVSVVKIYPMKLLGKIMGVCLVSSPIFLLKQGLSTHSALFDGLLYSSVYLAVVYALLSWTGLFQWRWLVRSVRGK
jgi:O-antigen/teichoic acid export membrane protein